MWGRRVRTGAVGAATIAAGLVLMAACVDVSDPRIQKVHGLPSSRFLSLDIATCNADLSAEVQETAAQVRIRVHAENASLDDCGDTIRLTIDDALGDRRVIDDRTGAELRVEPGVAGIGDPVRNGDFTFTVTAVEDGPPALRRPDGFVQPRGQFVLVHVTVRNDGPSPRLFAEEHQYLFDGEGRKSEGSIDRGDLFLADINPANTVEGVLVFDMASDAVPAAIELHDSPTSAGVTVLLGLTGT
jgi:hypothetical protein